MLQCLYSLSCTLPPQEFACQCVQPDWVTDVIEKYLFSWYSISNIAHEKLWHTPSGKTRKTWDPPEVRNWGEKSYQNETRLKKWSPGPEVVTEIHMQNSERGGTEQQCAAGNCRSKWPVGGAKETRRPKLHPALLLLSGKEIWVLKAISCILKQEGLREI